LLDESVAWTVKKYCVPSLRPFNVIEWLVDGDRSAFV